jgi:hypothetical protein
MTDVLKNKKKTFLLKSAICNENFKFESWRHFRCLLVPNSICTFEKYISMFFDFRSFAHSTAITFKLSFSEDNNTEQEKLMKTRHRIKKMSI